MLFAARSVLLSSLAGGIALLAACSGTGNDGSVTPSTGIAGSWTTQGTTRPSLHFELVLTGSSLSGAGTLGVLPIAPVSGPATPAYTGDNFTLTSGSFNSPNVSFTATLGANPDGAGGFWRGTLSFSGTLTGGTMTGSQTFTPPRTASQTFAEQTLLGATLTKQ